MYTLFIDTHDKNVVIILFKDGKVLEMKNVESKNKHSEIAMPLIVSTFEKANIDVKELNSVIVVNGPGSFTGERIAVTIGKTLAYTLNIPIRVIDSLRVLAINIDREKKIVSLPDRNGAFVGVYDSSNELIGDLVYLNKSQYTDYVANNDVVSDVEVNYEKVYDYVMSLPVLNPHEVKPLYVKGISVLNDK